ncbi:metallophosphoesterase [Treponema sp.]
MVSKEILVISDSHGNVKALVSVLMWAKERQIETLAFLGDGVVDVLNACNIVSFTGDVKLAKGNGDLDFNIPIFTTFEISEKNIFLCHGHSHGVDEGLHHLISMADQYKSDVLLFGHTHRVYWESRRDLLILNPGSLSRPRDSSHCSFATINCSPDKKPVFQYWKLKATLKNTFQVVEYYPK